MVHIEYISKNAKIGLVLLPIPELGFYPLEYYLYEFKDVGENLSYNKKYWDQYSSKINEYLQNITYPNIRKIETDKIFCNSFIKICVQLRMIKKFSTGMTIIYLTMAQH